MPEEAKFSNPEIEVHHRLAEWAVLCAEHTLHIFEENNPNDNRPRIAIESLREWLTGSKTVTECRKAAFDAHAAARESKIAAPVAAARAAGQAASVAHMWNHSSHVADYAAKAVALHAIENESTQARGAERDWQWSQLDENLRHLGFPKGK